MVEIQPELPPASLPCATRTSEPASSASSAACLSPTVWIHKIPRSCARAIKSAGTPIWNEIAAGWAWRVAAKASSLNGRPVWLTAKGRSVRDLRRAHCSRSSPEDRMAVPRLPSAPDSHTAAAKSTSSHGPKGASKIGTEMPNKSQKRVRSIQTS
jgi:hypothetical protein